MPAKKIKDEDLKEFIYSQLRNCYGWEDEPITEDMARNMRYFLGGRVLVESPDRSKVRSSDVQEVIDGVMPSLMRIFFGGEKIGTFQAFGPEDEEQAAQITEYIHNIVMGRHNAFEIFYNWFQDALIMKYGVVKRYWEESDTESVTEKYTGLDQEALLLLMEDPEITIIDMEPHKRHQAEPEDVGEEMPPEEAATTPVEQEAEALVDVICVRKVRHGRVKIENIPPDNFFISKAALRNNLQKAPFVAEAIPTTVGELKAMGFKFDENKVKVLIDPPAMAVKEARLTDLDQALTQNKHSSYGKDHEFLDPSIVPVMLYDVYCRLDLNGDGIAELNRILLAGEEVLKIEEVQEIPYSLITPRPVAHRIIGTALADLAAPLHELSTTLLRLLIDDYAFTNLGKYIVVTELSGKETVEDIYNPKAPHVIRTRSKDGVVPVPATGLPASTFSLLEYTQTLKENRTGITRYNQGLDANSLNKTATGISRIMDAATQKLEITARIFAETGVKDLYKAILRLVCQNQRKAEVVRLRGKWVTIDPTSWRWDRDFIVEVAVGTGGKEMQQAALQGIFQVLMGLKGHPQLSELVPAVGIREILTRLVQMAGIRNPDLVLASEEAAQMIDGQPNPMQAQMEQQQQLAQEKEMVELERRKADVAIRQIRSLDQMENLKAKMLGQSLETPFKTGVGR